MLADFISYQELFTWTSLQIYYYKNFDMEMEILQQRTSGSGSTRFSLYFSIWFDFFFFNSPVI
jgi:hypothetical protein